MPRTQVPVLVVTANSRYNLEPERTSVRFMALVEGHARNMLQWACKSLIDNKRSDKLLLAQVRAMMAVALVVVVMVMRLLRRVVRASERCTWPDG